MVTFRLLFILFQAYAPFLLECRRSSGGTPPAAHTPKPSEVMNPAAPRSSAVFGCLLLAGATLLTGCVSSTKYRMAPKKIPPPVMLDLRANTGTDPRGSLEPAEFILHTVIIYQGPGSWKRAAFWDEYIVSIANRGKVPFNVDSAVLSDLQGGQVGAGDNPWELEKLSKTWWQNAGSSGIADAFYIGAGSSELGAMASTFFYLSDPTAAAPALIVGAVAASATAIGMVVANKRGREKVEAEFNRRRLALPAIVPPGETIQGSLFFRITPGPQRLTLQCRINGEARELPVDLSPLAGLHLKEPPKANPTLPTPPPDPPAAAAFGPDEPNRE